MISYDRALFDLFCISTGIGIWPRFIEPQLLFTTRLKVPLKGLKSPRRIVQISDLHFGKHSSDRFFNRVLTAVNALSPDLIALTGDFICNGKMHDRNALFSFLKMLKAPHGLFAVLGNHDYEKGVGIDQEGNYGVVDRKGPVLQGLARLVNQTTIHGGFSEEALRLKVNPVLIDVFDEAGVVLLKDRTTCIADHFNLTGVSEYMTGQIDEGRAFQGYQACLPGILLCHNPDAIPHLLHHPFSLVLSGHTHGGQINLPWIRKKLTMMQYPRYFKGLIQEAGKTIYISRGLGSVMNFRFFAPPEIVCIDLIPEVSDEM
jgi:predicted MPP superfamily phosphohydrolase